MFYYSEAVDSHIGKENKKKFKRGPKQISCSGTGKEHGNTCVENPDSKQPTTKHES